jgi:hypothetical protein
MSNKGQSWQSCQQQYTCKDASARKLWVAARSILQGSLLDMYGGFFDIPLTAKRLLVPAVLARRFFSAAAAGFSFCD